MRVLIDTNVLISYLLLSSELGAIREIFTAYEAGKFVLLVPEPLVQELVATVRGIQRLSSRISVEELGAFVRFLRFFGVEMQAVTQPIPSVTRDTKDDYLLAYARVGEADYLVTGDKDLLALQGIIAGLEIVTPAQFAELL